MLPKIHREKPGRSLQFKQLTVAFLHKVEFIISLNGKKWQTISVDG